MLRICGCRSEHLRRHPSPLSRMQSLVIHLLLLCVGASCNPSFSCVTVNQSLVSPFCSSAVLKPRTCSLGPEPDAYTRTAHGFKTQAQQCSTPALAADTCDNDPSACTTLSFNEYCDVSAPLCETDADCLPFCYTDCYPCNLKADCNEFVDFGIVAKPGAPCSSVHNHTATLASLRYLLRKDAGTVET